MSEKFYNPPTSARAIASRLRSAGQPALARALIKAAGTTFMVEIKEKPPSVVIDPEGKHITKDDLLDLLASYIREEGKYLKNRLKVQDVSPRNKWFTVYVESPSDKESAMYAAETEVMRMIREAADRYPELRQWSDDIQDKSLDLSVLG